MAALRAAPRPGAVPAWPEPLRKPRSGSLRPPRPVPAPPAAEVPSASTAARCRPGLSW